MNWKEKVSLGLIEVIELKDHKVRRYENRIAIWRNDGRRLSWEEIQKVKQEVWGDALAIEVYPAECDVVNLRHTRHLWKGDEITNAVNKLCQHREFANI